MYKKISFCLSLFLLLIACKEEEHPEIDLLILNANVIDVEAGTILEDKFIAVSMDTIYRVDDMANQDQLKAKDPLDVGGNFVMPGLWDMHVHFRGGDSLVQENKNLLPLFLAYGVTTVRDAGGDITASVLQWREDIRNKKLDGPRIFTSGPKLDGTDPAWPGSFKVAEKEDIEAALDSLQELEADYVKMYDGNLTEEAFYNIIQMAEKRGMKTTGHMPLSADFRKAIDYGLDGSEHMYYLLKASSPKADSLSKLNLGYGMMESIVDSFDPELAEVVYKQMRENEVFLTPTLHIGKTLGEILDVDHSQDSLLPRIGKGIQETYQGRIESAKRSRARGGGLRSSKLEDLTLVMIEPIYDAGVNLVAGSDCGPYNSYVYPGASLHGELERMVSAGLSPQEALTTSIINGPKFFDLENYYGSIEDGKVADLVILTENPLETIDFKESVESVFKGGKIYDRETLTKMLKNLKE